MSLKFKVGLGGAVLGILGALACGRGAQSVSPVPDAGLIAVPLGSSPIRGPSDAWVTMVEFADFQCPYCGAEEPAVTSVEAAYGADLRVVFKHFPLSQHPAAQPAAVAAECAHDQSRFWELHDRLFAHQDALGPAQLEAYAQDAGVDVPSWKACLATQPPKDRVQGDVTLATQLGVDATPTFIVNGVPVVGAVPEADLRGAIDNALSRAKASGVARVDYYDKVVLGH